MSARDEMWADLTQFDHQAADGVWDGSHRDPDAPPWYRDLRALIHRARGPAESHELLDEPLVVDTMYRVRMGRSISRPPRSPRLRTLGRILAMKAAAATTASVVGVAAAAAATTGIVAVATTSVVVPVVTHRIMPMINQHIAPAIVSVETADPARSSPPPHSGTTSQRVVPGEPVEATAPLAAPVTDPASAGATTGGAAAPAAKPAPTEPAAVAPAPTEPVAPAPTEPAAVAPAPTEPVTVAEQPPAPGNPTGADPCPSTGRPRAKATRCPPTPHAPAPARRGAAGGGVTPAG